MNNILTSIPQILQKQGFGGPNQGLLHGNMGISIFLYHLSRATGNPEPEEMADQLLDKVFASLTTQASTDFEHGLAGIGWGIEYLLQNGFADGNADEILDEVDTKVYRTLTHENLPNNFEFTNGLTGYLWFLNSRLKNKTDTRAMTYRINRELLIHLINHLDVVVTEQFPAIVKELSFDLFWKFPAVLQGIMDSYRLNIFNHKIEMMVKQWHMYFEAYIPSLHINRIYMAWVIHRLNQLFPSKKLERQVQVLLFATCFEEMGTEYDPNHAELRLGWPSALWVLKQALKSLPPGSPNFKEIETYAATLALTGRAKLENLFATQAETQKPLNPGINSGITGMGLMELLYPGIS